MHPTPASRHRPSATTVAGLAAAALVSAVIPAAAGLAFLISLAARRPLIAVAARRWPWVAGRPAAQLPHRTLTALTAAWAIGLLAAGAVQGAGALTGGLSFTSPGGFAARALIALAIQATLAALTIAWLHRSPAPARRPATHTPEPSLPPGPDRSFRQQQTHRDLPSRGR
jgi:hypothetical protein